jgi:hypothetical protein
MVNLIKRTFEFLYGIFENLGKARAGAYLARNGKWKEAQDLFRN